MNSPRSRADHDLRARAASCAWSGVSGSLNSSPGALGASAGSVPRCSSIRRSDACVLSSPSFDSPLPLWTGRSTSRRTGSSTRATVQIRATANGRPSVRPECCGSTTTAGRPARRTPHAREDQHQCTCAHHPPGVDGRFPDTGALIHPAPACGSATHGERWAPPRSTDAPAVGYGLNTILIAPSCFFWNVSYARGASSSGRRCVVKSANASGSDSSVTSGMMSPTQRFTCA